MYGPFSLTASPTVPGLVLVPLSHDVVWSPLFSLTSGPPVPVLGLVPLFSYMMSGPLFPDCTQKKIQNHVIKLDIAPKSYPPGQYLLVSASNNMLYYLIQ
jgi:hypothetical protein